MAPTSSGQLAMNLEPGVSNQLPITLSLKSVLGKNSLFILRKGNFVYYHWGWTSNYFPTSDLFAQSILNRFHSIFFLTPIPPPLLPEMKDFFDRIVTFLLNAFVLHRVDREVLGLVNMRLTLLGNIALYFFWLSLSYARSLPIQYWPKDSHFQFLIVHLNLNLRLSKLHTSQLITKTKLTRKKITKPLTYTWFSAVVWEQHIVKLTTSPFAPLPQILFKIYFTCWL